MKFLSDFLPVLLFFVVYFIGQRDVHTAWSVADQLLAGLTRDGTVPPELAPIMLATAVAVVAISLQIAVLLALRKYVGPVQWLTFAVFLVFGGATIYFHDDNFIKWKPTVLYWIFACALFVSHAFFKHNLIRSLMESNGVRLQNPMWNRLNLVWIGFFALVGLLNIYVAYNFSRDFWVSFKAFGLTGLTLAFAVIQGFFLNKHSSDSPEVDASPDAAPAAASKHA